MKFLKIFIPFILFLTLSTSIAYAMPPISNTYKQGVYKMSACSERSVIVKSTNKNTINHLTILDSQCNVKFSQKFDHIKLSNCKIPIQNNDFIVIVGDGELSLIFQSNS